MIDRIIFLEQLATRAHPPLRTRLYTDLGYQPEYDYWYRVKTGGGYHAN